MAAYFRKTALLCVLMHVIITRTSGQVNDIQSMIETLHLTYEDNIAMVTERLEENERDCNRQMHELEQRILHLESENKHLADESKINKKKIAALTKTINSMLYEMDNNEHGNDKGMGMDSPSTAHGLNVDNDVELQTYQAKYYNRKNRALDDSLNIAFTTYLDHDLDNQVKDQVLIFNKVLLNDGNVYNNVTGTFTAPTNGVYSFTFHVGQRDINEVRAYLVVNGQHQVDAAAESLHASQDVQGGNTAALRLSLGDSVYVTHQGSYDHIEGDDILRTTTFSGFLIYPVEEPAIVGK